MTDLRIDIKINRNLKFGHFSHVIVEWFSNGRLNRDHMERLFALSHGVSSKVNCRAMKLKQAENRAQIM